MSVESRLNKEESRELRNTGIITLQRPGENNRNRRDFQKGKNIPESMPANSIFGVEDLFPHYAKRQM